MRISAIAVLITGLLISRSAAAQTLQYDRTLFLHGFNDGPDRWKVGKNGTSDSSPVLRLSRRIDLGQSYYTPQLTGTQSILYQSNELRSGWIANTNRYAVVGLSMGGLVARKAYRDGATQITGIVTVATPHRGTLLANHSPLLYSYFIKVADRVTAGLQFLAMPVKLKALRFRDLHLNPTRNTVERLYGIQSAGMNDLKINSAAVSQLVSSGDTIPRANVYGVASMRHTVFRLKHSEAHDDAGLDGTIDIYNVTKSLFKACKQVGRILIFGLVAETPCEKAEKTLASIDDTWLIYVNGADTTYAGPFQVRTIKRDPFDGVVSNWRSQYPGLVGKSFPVDAANHLSIQYVDTGIRQIANAMAAIGMFTR